MSHIVSVHSFRGGTGKSNISASLATLVANRGLRVGVIDTDIQSPGIHVIFGLDDRRMNHALNDYLWGRCAIQEAAYEVAGGKDGAHLWVIPSSLRTGEITRVLREGYDVSRLNDGFRELIRALELDYLFIDTHPGLNEETLLSIAVSDVLFIVMRPDQQDYEGTAVTVEVARRLEVPRLHMLVNKIPASFDAESVRARVAEAYGCPVAGVLPLSDEMVVLGSSQVFVNAFPEHPLSLALARVAEIIVGGPVDP